MSTNLNAKQKEAWKLLFDKRTRTIMFGGAAGGGKSWLMNEWFITNCEKYPGVRYLMARNILKYLKETTLATFFKVCKHHNIDGRYYEYKQQSGLIKWHNGSEILLRELRYNPSDPLFQDLGSLELTGAGIDEMPEISFAAFDVLKSRIGRQYNSKYDIFPKILGTGNPVKNWVYNLFINNNTNPENRFIQSLVDDNLLFIDKTYIGALESITDPTTYQRLRLGNWEYDDDPGLLCKYQKILDAYTNDWMEPGENYITVDVARKGKDKSVIAIWNGWTLVKLVEMATNTITELAEKIQTLRKQYRVPIHNIIADEDGVGGGLVDILNCNGFINNSKPIENKTNPQATENFQNLRSQCIFKFCGKINDNDLYLQCPNPEQQIKINEELAIVKRTDTLKDGKVTVMGRDEFIKQIGRSPDYLSALMQRIWFDLGVRNFTGAKISFL